jgi:flagellar capping protein FliD
LTGTFSTTGYGYSGNVTGSLSSNGFTFKPTNSGHTGDGKGSFYGSNANSVGGNFNLSDGNSTYSGVFKAKNTSTP